MSGTIVVNEVGKSYVIFFIIDEWNVGISIFGISLWITWI
jgi:hypothetical protein